MLAQLDQVSETFEKQFWKSSALEANLSMLGDVFLE
jgi:hypothetical protein